MMTDLYAPPLLKVKGDTDVGSLSKSLRMTLAESGVDARVVVRAMGAPAVNQMCKGIIVAQKDLAAQGKCLHYRFGFHTAVEGGNDITAVEAVCRVTDLAN